jgi:hypothetical protein
MDTYGVPLTTFNGRLAFEDAIEELVDLTQYMEQARCEAETVAKFFYVYAITEGFFNTLPEHMQRYILQIVDGKNVSDICMEEGIDFYGTVKSHRSKII